MNNRFVCLLGGLLALLFPAFGQEGRISFDVTSSINWIRGELNAQVSYDLTQAGLKLPAGRFMGEETLKEAAPRLIRPSLFSLRLDSSSTVKDMVDRRELSVEELDALSMQAENVPPSLSGDLSRMIGRYTVILDKISALIYRHRQAAEPPRPLVPVQTVNYTGIIIIADGDLPIHGRNTTAQAEPCLSPKIWDSDMNLVYERNMTDPARGTLMVRYAAPESIFRPTPSGLDGDLAALAGPNPLRILARELFGITPTDPVIDRDDALKILSTDNNRRLLREGRVILVLNANRLQ